MSSRGQGRTGKPHILFRVDAGESLGLGHLARCRSLIAGFDALAKCNFVVASNRKDLVSKFLGNLEVTLCDSRLDFNGKPFDIAIIDVPDVDLEEQHRLRQLCRILVCIDDEGPGFFGQDIMIRPNLAELPEPSLISSNTQCWSGKDYIILHPDFQEYVQRQRKRCGGVRQLLVCFGGSDPGKLTLRVIPLLQRLPKNLQARIVLGAAFPWRDEVSSLVGPDSRFIVNYNLPNMAKAFWHSDVAIISGGTLLYEACSLGVPSIVVSQNRAQEEEAIRFQEANAIINPGVNEAVSDEEIFDALQQLILSHSLRKTMSKLASQLVSANGTERIVSRLLNLLTA